MPAASVSVARRSRASFHEGANPESAVQARLSRSNAGTAAAVATPLKKVVLADRRRAAAATVSTGGLLGNHFDQLSDESKAAQLQTSHIATTSCDTQIVFPLPREIGEELGVEELEGLEGWEDEPACINISTHVYTGVLRSSPAKRPHFCDFDCIIASAMVL